MGPGLAITLPSSPRFSWDTCNTTWTEGVCGQKAYAEAVELSCSFQNTLSDYSFYKVEKSSRGILWKVILIGRVKLSYSGIEPSVIKIGRKFVAIVDKLYKIVTLSTCSAAFTDSVKNLDNRCISREYSGNTEPLVSFGLTKLNRNIFAVLLSDALPASILINNIGIFLASRLRTMTAATSSALNDELTC